MRCSKCGGENPESKRFCGDCGAPLLNASSALGPMVRPAVSPTLSSSEASAVPEGERKTVTALFADLKGSTALMEELDPEEARAIIDPALRIMIEAVKRYDGYVVQSTGDGIFALFGAPAAYEDHPQRGLYAALQMQQELRDYGERRAAAGHVRLEARIGVNTGEVVVRSVETGGRVEYTPIGHTANLAARLQTTAPAGSIAVSEHTRRLVEGYFELRALGPTAVRGISEAIEVYEVTGLGSLRTHFELSTRRGLTKFVGRESELDQMRRALELAMDGHGQMVAVVAEAGTGKSRLYYEFKATLPVECKVLEAYSVSHGKASAWLPVLELLRKYFGIADADDAATRREKVSGALQTLDPALNDATPYLFGLLGIIDGADPLAQMDPQIKKQRTLDAIKRIVVRESLKQPLIVIFEDLHWIDEQTQALLDLLADSIANARVLLLVNYRPEYRHKWSNKSHYVQIGLKPLGRESAEELLAALLEDAVELQPLKRLIIERSGGNPFFIEEMVQALFDEGALVRNGTVRVTRARSQLRFAADGAGDTGGAHRSAVGGAEGAIANYGGDRARIAARADQHNDRAGRGATGANVGGVARGRVHL
jgi:class 3 adenylate cyclase